MSQAHANALDAEFARLNHLRFSGPVEARFDAVGLDQRKGIGRVSLMIGMLIYDATLLTDWQVVPDMIGWLAFLRLSVFTPIVVFFLSVIPRTTAVWQVDAIAVFGSTIAVLLPTAAMVFSESQHVLAYQFGSMLTLTYFTIVQRVRFRFAVVGLVLALLVQVVCVAQRPEIDAADFGFVVNFYVSGAVLLLLGSFIMERIERQGFLEHLRAERLIEEIEDIARTDRLTGMSNRHHLAHVGPTISSGSPASGVAALMIDIDHFKRFNDTQGHLAGDRCIRAVADVIRASLEAQEDGSPHYAFRYGGEEFLLLLRGRDAARAALLGERIKRRLAAEQIPHPGLDGGALVTVSIGVATCPIADFSLEALVERADGALYRAKQEGRNRLVLAA